MANFQYRGGFLGLLLIVCFLAGLVMFSYRDIIPWSGKLAAASAAISMALVSFFPYGDYASPIPIDYLTVYLGLTNFRRAGLLRYGDLSYGIFLYGFVVQQTVAHLLPWSRHWYLNFAIALPLTVLVAAVSWHFVERPALGLRSHLVRIETWYLSRRDFRRALLAASRDGRQDAEAG
jgi:peptidoglycan/LPS O-acetylase OafA/YrhL